MFYTFELSYETTDTQAKSVLNSGVKRLWQELGADQSSDGLELPFPVFFNI